MNADKLEYPKNILNPGVPINNGLLVGDFKISGFFALKSFKYGLYKL